MVSEPISKIPNFFFPATMTSTPTSSAAAESSEPATISPTAQMTSPTFSSSPATQPLSSAASISQQASSLSSQTMAASTTLPFMSMDPVISQTWMPPPLMTEFSAWNPPLFTWTPTQPSVRPPVQPVLSTGRSFLPPMESASNFAGPTFAGAPGIAPLSSPRPIAPRSTAANTGSILNELVKSIGFSALNITNVVTTKLAAVEDYQYWRTQFESFLLSNGFLGILDGSIPAPPPYIFDAFHLETINPDYCNWLKLDQTVRSWLFATLSRDVLIEVHDLKNASAIWSRLESHFMSASLARSMELKRQLTTSRKGLNQSMEHYLRDIKIIADNLASINDPVAPRELFKTILMGLGRDYESLITSVGLFPESFTFERLRNCLIEKEQTIQYMRTLEEPPQAQAFAVQAQATGQPPPHGGQQQRGRGYRGRGGRGQRGRGGRGQRGRGYAPHQHGYGFPPPMGYGYPPPGYVPGGAPHAGILGAPGSAGSSSVDGHSVPPPVVCQICYAPGHPASTCPSRFVQPAAPALAAQAPDATDIVWYPDSGASAHMTPHPGQNYGGGSTSSGQ
ncbi:unnamed protein product [Cuscuta epithymum]|uniref:Uncharacterized protein n=1 Tax=Cuscuta epithymum TaxID=186058 RepID=A0AAV0EUA6_9ASTE|nr:unnamed protein product [Cuscuta epithymum]